MVAMLFFNALYFRIVSPEEFSIISLLLTATIIAPSLDFGFGRAAGRILSSDLATGRDANGLRNAVLTLQVVNLAIAVAVGVALIISAPFVATSWFDAETLSSVEITGAIILIAISLALMIQRAYVNHCLNGMKYQVHANVLLFLFTLFRGLAGLIVLHIYDGGLHAFLWSQLIVQILDSVVSSAVVLRLLPPSDSHPQLDPQVVRTSWRFAAGDGSAAIIGVCLSQGDKILLSTLLPLSTYGSYALISTVASGIGRFTSPFSAAFLPHFVELTALEKEDELQRDYILSTQLLSCVILPIAIIMFVFAPEIVNTVLGTPQEKGPLPGVFVLLVAATILGNLMHLPHGIQLAAGNSVTAMWFSAINAVVYVVFILIATPTYGIVAPAIVLFVIQSVTIFLFTRISHRMLGLSGGVWLLNSVLRPGAAAAVVIIPAWMITSAGIGAIPGVIWLSVIAMAAVASALGVSPGARKILANRFGIGV